jgi:TonB family protein
MNWSRERAEVSELRQFVEAMKRGQTPATPDSLLETLRQIHDRPEPSRPGHAHKEMLRQRLRRQMAERASGVQPGPVRTLVPASHRSSWLGWPIAASLIVHLTLGVTALLLIRIAVPREVAVRTDSDVDLQNAVLLASAVVARTPLSTRAVEAAPSGHRGWGPVGAVASTPRPAPLTPPPPHAAGPLVEVYSSNVDANAEAGLAGPPDALPGPPLPDEPEPFTEVGGVEFLRATDVAPRPISLPHPRYPAKALEYLKSGSVRLTFVVAVDGTTQDIRVVRGLGYGMDEAAIEAVRQCRFRPALRDGQPVPVMTTIEVQFGLR